MKASCLFHACALAGVERSRYRTQVGSRVQFIPSTVPKIEYKAPQELDSAVLDIYRCTQAADIFGDIIAEDDAAHGRFARARLAHEEDLLLLGFLKAVHTGSFPGSSSTVA